LGDFARGRSRLHFGVAVIRSDFQGGKTMTDKDIVALIRTVAENSTNEKTFKKSLKRMARIVNRVIKKGK
jgi:hypothetical protein